MRKSRRPNLRRARAVARWGGGRRDIGRLQKWRGGQCELLLECREEFTGQGGICGALFGGDGGESLLKLGVAVVLAGFRCGERLSGGGELRSELSAIATVRAPGDEKEGKQGDESKFSEAKCVRHGI